ncbi:divalent metal cation transporter [Rhodoluna sp. KAS3]|uniref:NRAMP family divalent metal transporter n=1 Tax=Rhodoluna sp. KAS3 TaxID=942880 RepID=UPI00222F38BD|nr:divalent metal cation transporter [Rhodoluna sp. KAS3]BDS48546.1 iron transporter [Rhodoluna sp. KAS3]
MRRHAKQHHPVRSEIASSGYFNRLGPGLVTGAADDDPSGIGTYSQAGASAGFGFLWSTFWLLPLAFAVQEACARLALVTGQGLAAIIKSRLPRWVLVLAVVLVAIANTVNIAADLSIMSAALGLLVPINQLFGVVMFAVLLGLSELFIPYHRYAKVLRWLTLSLLAYVAVLFVADIDWGAVAVATVLPGFGFDKASIAMLLALAGTTISPYLFFWQAAEEIEERNEPGVRVSGTHMRAMRGDVFAGMFTGVFIMFAIMVTAGATLHAQGITQIESAADAAAALAPIAGPYAGLLFLLGILGVGLLSIPVLAGSTAYAVAETFGWRESLELQPRQAKAFYGVIVLSMLVALGLNLVSIPPVNFLILAAIFNGLAAPVLMVIVWVLARDKQLLGRWVSPRWSQILLGFAVLAMFALPVMWLLAP